MHYINLLPLTAAFATAIVLPDEATAQELGREVGIQSEKAGNSGSPWWESLRHAPETAFDYLDKKADQLVGRIDSFFGFDTEDVVDSLGLSWPGHGRHGHRGPLNYTIYEAIHTSNYTKKFAALVDDFPDIVDLLNSTETNVTVFVPIDKAFEKIPDHGHKPPKEFIERLLEYHIVPDFYPAGRVLASHTLPTTLKSKALGGRPQRLRARLGLFGLKLNYISKIISPDIFLKNGVAHGVNNLIVPPPPAGRLISLFPAKFSTLELAAAKTGLTPHHHKHHDDDKDGKHSGGDDDDHKHHHGFHTTGLTIFAPTNTAFAKLGPAANAFLFNTEKGLGYLRALLKYHIVVNETLYSDAYYGLKGGADDLLFDDDNDDEDSENNGGKKNGHFHVDLPTLLDGKSLSIDIARLYGLITIRINGYNTVTVEDGVAFDGVLQIVSSVLIPPRDGKSGAAAAAGWTDEDGEIPVEELIEILQPYVDAEDVDEKTSAGEQVWGEL